MEQIRSKGVTFWAWAFIVMNTWGVVVNVWDFSRILEHNGVLWTVLGLGMTVAYLVTGIFLLRLNELARRAAIYLGFLSVAVMPFSFVPAYNAVLTVDRQMAEFERSRPKLDLLAEKDAYRTKRFDARSAFAFLYLVVGVTLLFEIIPVLFFLHPKVKEQFNQKGSQS